MAFLGSLDTNTQNALKIAYSKREAAMFFDNRPTTGLLTKTFDNGLQYSNTMTTDLGQGVSNLFTQAQADAAAMTRYKMVIDWVEKFSVAVLPNTRIQLAKNAGPRATVNYLMSETEASISRLAESLERAWWRSGYGDIGQIAVGGISGAVITLTNRSDARNFTPGKKVVFASGISTGLLRGVTQHLVVSSVNYDDGTGVAKITFTANVSTITGGGGVVAVGDYCFSIGDRQDSATPDPRDPVGIPGWIPATAAAGTLFGVNRDVARDLLAGIYTTGTNKSALEATMDHLARVREYGKRADTMFCTFDWANKLAKELTAKSTLKLPGTGKAEGIIYTGFTFNGPTGDVDVIPVPACPPNAFWALTRSTFKIISANDGGKLIDNPLSGGKQLDVYNADSVELRNKFLGAMVCEDPSQNSVCRVA